MEELSRYESYKDSGVEWLGEIPSHWCVGKLKYYGKFVSGIAIDSKKLNDESNGIQYLRTNDINTESSIRKDKVYFNGEIDSEYIKSRDEFVICFDGFNSVLGRGTLGLFTNSGEGIMCSEINKIKATKDCMVDRYMMYSAGMESNLHLIVANSRGAIAKHAGHTKREMLTVIPPKEEQELITKYIDRKVSAIDSVIAKKQQLIEKLKLSKQALITETVTKGLDDTVPMKDSGVDWIGKIPSHWKVCRVKDIADLNRETIKDNVDKDLVINYIDIGSVNSYGEVNNIQEIKFVNAPSRARRIVRDRDIIISTVRTYLRAIASFDRVVDNTICSTGFAVISANKNINYKYLAYFIKSNGFIDNVVANSKGVSYPAINGSEIMQFNCLLCSEDEQNQIANYLDKKVGEFDRLIELQEQSIENLKLTKQKLITEVVTGKIKVC